MTTTLGKICDIYNGNSINATYKKTHFEGLAEGYPFIATKDISFHGQVNYENGVKIPFNTKYKKAHNDSILICAEGGSAGRKIARVNQTICFGNKLFCLKPKDDCIEQDYLYYYLMSASFQEQFKESITGVIGGVSSSKIKAFHISFPDVDEQRKIVERLNATFDKIDEMQKNAEQARHELENIIQERYSYYFGPQNERAQLGSILNLRRGHDLTHAQMISGEIPVAGSNGVIGWHNDKTNISPCVTVGRSGSVGMVNFYDRCWAHNTVLYVDNYKGNNPRYIYHLLKGLPLKEQGGGVAVPTLNRNNLHPLLVGYTPNIEEQIRVARDLDELTSKVKNLEDHYTKIITLCNDLKRSLLKSIFE